MMSKKDNSEDSMEVASKINLFFYKHIFYPVNVFFQRYWSSDISIALILLALFFYVKKWLIVFVSTNILDIVFENKEGAVLLDILSVTIFVSYLATLSLFLYRYKIHFNFRSFFYIVVIATVYISLRLYSGLYFWGFSFYPNIYYTDIICLWLFFVIPLRRSLRVYPDLQIENESKQQCLLSNDNLFEEDKKDRYLREKYAKFIFEQIDRLELKRSFSVGIIGKWGSGKSVFLRLLEKHFTDNKFILIKYNPWRFSSENSITESFFHEYEKAITGYYPGISSSINRYARAFSENNDNLFSRVIKSFSFLLQKKSTYENLYQKIRTTLSNIDKKIIVFIDDLDRLEDAEIKAVLRIIRNSADFPNTCFFVAYDHFHVLSTFNEENCPEKRNFLDKIIQIEIPLPSYPDNYIFDLTFEILGQKLATEDMVNIRSAFSELMNDLSNLSEIRGKNAAYEFFNFFIINIRDAIRFLNSFNLIYSNRKGEVDLKQLILIELLKVKYFVVYDLLKTKILFERICDGNLDNGYYSIKSDVKIDIFSNTFKQLNYSKITIDRFSIILEYLFPCILQENQKNLLQGRFSPVSINRPENHVLYFSSELFFNISKREYDTVIESDDFEFVISKMKTWADESKTENLELFISNTLNNYNIKSYFNAVCAKIYFASKKQEGDYHDIYNSVNSFLALIGDIFRTEIEVASEKNEFYNNFLERVFHNLKIPVEKRLRFLIKFKKHFQGTIPINLDSLLLALTDSFINESSTIPFESFNIIKEALNDYPEKTKVSEYFQIIKKKIEPNVNIQGEIKKFIELRKNDNWALNRLLYPSMTCDEVSSYLSVLPDEPEIYTARSVMELISLSDIESANFSKNSFIIHSDPIKDVFIDSDFKGIDSRKFETTAFLNHSWRQKIIKQDPDFENYPWIAHAQEISTVEAQNGGVYRFVRMLPLNFDVLRITSCVFEFCVDDFIEVLINSKIAFIQSDHFRGKITQTPINTKLFIRGENRIELKIRNKKGRPNSTFNENPYAMVYRFVFEYE